MSPVKIGSNVFIGMNTIILRGVIVGDNVIIGAGSVVTKDIPANEVWAGNPAKKIMTLEEYYRRKKEESRKDALLLAKKYQNNAEIRAKVMREYAPLFTDTANNEVQNLMAVTGYKDVAEVFYKDYKREFENMDQMIHYVSNKEQD